MAATVHDRIRESVIIMVGELCAFLAPTDPRIPHVINKLMAALGTPSEQVRPVGQQHGCVWGMGGRRIALTTGPGREIVHLGPSRRRGLPACAGEDHQRR